METERGGQTVGDRERVKEKGLQRQGDRVKERERERELENKESRG